MGKNETNKLFIPEPPFRPGEKPNYDNLSLPEKGVAKKPDILADPEEIRSLARDLIQVLDSNGEALGDWNPELDQETLIRGLRLMVTQRMFDDRMIIMQRQGKLSFYVQSLGEEAVSIAGGMALRNDDLLFPSYRQPGLLFVRGRSMLDMMCHCISNTKDNLKGRQMPIHYSWKEGDFVSISSPVGTQFPQAVGAAMASAYKGEDKVTATWIGEGTASEGDFHYALNFASVYKVPVIMHVVNNQWAISTHRNIASGGMTFAARGVGYNMPSIRVDGNDFLALYSVTKWAADRARKGGGPTFIEVCTYRGAAHSSSDDPSRYRAKDEWSHFPLGDPVKRLKQHLILLGCWSEEKDKEMRKEIDQEIIKTYKEAETYGTLSEGPYPGIETLFEDVYKEPLWNQKEQWQELQDLS